jgi:hypothetical protein
MHVKKYTFQWMYIGFIAGGYTLAFFVAILSRPFPGITDPFVSLNIAFIIFLFSVLKFGFYCAFDQTSFYRVSYFHFQRSIPVENINEMKFQPTYVFGGYGRSLWIIGHDGSGTPTTIQMTDMAYTRPALVDIVKTLIRINSSIILDEDAKALLK